MSISQLNYGFNAVPTKIPAGLFCRFETLHVKEVEQVKTILNKKY